MHSAPGRRHALDALDRIRQNGENCPSRAETAPCGLMKRVGTHPNLFEATLRGQKMEKTPWIAPIPSSKMKKTIDPNSNRWSLGVNRCAAYPLPGSASKF